MNIRRQVREQIDRLAQQSGPAAIVNDARRSFTIPLETGGLRVELADLQPLGCALWQLDVRTDQTSSASADQLMDRGQRLAERATYLIEPLQVHEVDPRDASVQLRSTPPQRDDRLVSYFEVIAERDGGWRLVRFQKKPDEARQQVPAVMTHEVLERLCMDVVDVATQ